MLNNSKYGYAASACCTLGVILLLVALPLDSLSGTGRGFLASPTAFRGYDIIIFSVLFPFFGVNGLPWIIIAAANGFLLASPILLVMELVGAYKRPRVLFAAWAVASASAIPLLIVLWPDGCLVGAWIWALSVASMSVGTLLSLLRPPKLHGHTAHRFEVLPKK